MKHRIRNHLQLIVIWQEYFNDIPRWPSTIFLCQVRIDRSLKRFRTLRRTSCRFPHFVFFHCLASDNSLPKSQIPSISQSASLESDLALKSLILGLLTRSRSPIHFPIRLTELILLAKQIRTSLDTPEGTRGNVFRRSTRPPSRGTLKFKMYFSIKNVYIIYLSIIISELIFKVPFPKGKTGLYY